MRRIPRRPRRVAAVAIAAAALILIGNPGSRAAGGPDSRTQSLVDGCQRSNAMDLTLTTPEWVYVNHAQVLAARLAGDQKAGRKTAEGVVQESHPAGDDLFINHDFNDIDVDLAPDPAYANLAASGNGGDLGTEWEATRIPTWAWPKVGDRVRESGSWIWDCGHWGNGPADDTHGVSELLPYDPEETAKDLAQPGTLRGEQTELHPLYEVATWRKDAAGVLAGQETGTNLSHLDVWLNGDGAPALGEEECALKGVPPAGFRAACSQYRDISGTYTYSIPLGPKPGPGSHIVVNPVVVHPETDDALKDLQVDTRIDHRNAAVDVTFTIPLFAAPLHFGISVDAGWTGAAPAVHHVVTLQSLHIEKSLDGGSEPNQNPVGTGPEQTPGPGEWVLYAQANGHWQQVPGITEVNDGQTVNLRAMPAFDYWLPAGVPPTLYVSGRECDIPLIDCTREAYGANGVGSTPFHEVGFNDHPGRIQTWDGPRPTETGVVLPPGTSIVSPSHVSAKGNGNEDESDFTCPKPTGCYEVTVTNS